MPSPLRARRSTAAESLCRDHPEVPAHRGLRATAYGDLAVFLSAKEVGDEARDAFRKAVSAYADLIELSPDDAQSKRMFVTHASNLAHALVLDGRRASLAEARLHATRALAVVRQEVDRSQNPSRLINAVANLADIESADGRSDEALALAKEAIATAARWRSNESGSLEAGFAVIQATNSIAALALARGDLAGANDALRRRAAADAIPDEARQDRDLRSDLALLARLEARAAMQAGEFPRDRDRPRLAGAVRAGR